MSQHDMVIDNGPGLAVRTDMNAAIQALVQQNSGPVEPTTMYPGMLWLDTTVAPDGLLRQRNQANNAWITPQTGVAGPPISNIATTVLTTSGTYAKSANLKFLEVCCVGGGGGGSRAGATGAGQASAGGGGGGAGVSYKLYKASDLAASEAYTVGAAGAAPGGVGATGGASVFKGVTANGGGGGSTLMTSTANFNFSTRGAGTGATGGDINVQGTSGTGGEANVHGVAGLAKGGDGGGSFLAPTRTAQYSNTAVIGTAGAFPGGGGSGESNGPAIATGGSGTAGGAGCIIIKEYF